MHGDHLQHIGPYTGIIFTIDQETGTEEGRNSEGVRGRALHFHFSNMDRIFKNKLPTARGSTEIPNEGAGFMETRAVCTQRQLLSRLIILPPALLVPTALKRSSYHLQLTTEGNIPNLDIRERKQPAQTW